MLFGLLSLKKRHRFGWLLTVVMICFNSAAIAAQIPHISEIQPQSKERANNGVGGTFALTIRGSNFDSTSRVQVNGAPVEIQRVTPDAINVIVPNEYISYNFIPSGFFRNGIYKADVIVINGAESDAPKDRALLSVTEQNAFAPAVMPKPIIRSIFPNTLLPGTSVPAVISGENLHGTGIDFVIQLVPRDVPGGMTHNLTRYATRVESGGVSITLPGNIVSGMYDLVYMTVNSSGSEIGRAGQIVTVGNPPSTTGSSLGSCNDPWVSKAVQEVTGSPAKGSGNNDQCNIMLYGNGHWSSYPDLLEKVKRALKPQHMQSPQITFVSPRNGQNFTAGSNLRLNWTFVGDISNRPATLVLYKGNTPVPGLADRVPVNQQSYVWKIPPNMPLGEYRIFMGVSNVVEPFFSSTFKVGVATSVLGGGTLPTVPPNGGNSNNATGNEPLPEIPQLAQVAAEGERLVSNLETLVRDWIQPLAQGPNAMLDPVQAREAMAALAIARSLISDPNNPYSLRAMSKGVPAGKGAKAANRQLDRLFAASGLADRYREANDAFLDAARRIDSDLVVSDLPFAFRSLAYIGSDETLVIRQFSRDDLRDLKGRLRPPDHDKVEQLIATLRLSRFLTTNSAQADFYMQFEPLVSPFFDAAQFAGPQGVAVARLYTLTKFTVTLANAAVKAVIAHLPSKVVGFNIDIAGDQFPAGNRKLQIAEGASKPVTFLIVTETAGGQVATPLGLFGLALSTPSANPKIKKYLEVHKEELKGALASRLIAIEDYLTGKIADISPNGWVANWIVGKNFFTVPPTKHAIAINDRRVVGLHSAAPDNVKYTIDGNGHSILHGVKAADNVQVEAYVRQPDLAEWLSSKRRVPIRVKVTGNAGTNSQICTLIGSNGLSHQGFSINGGPCWLPH